MSPTDGDVVQTSAAAVAATAAGDINMGTCRAV